MLKQIRFKNWRNLRDVTIDLSPITVFIGANSSGKSNIIEALGFRKHAIQHGLLESVLGETFEKILSKSPIDDGVVELEFVFEHYKRTFGETLRLKFDGRTVPFSYTSFTSEGGDVVDRPALQELPLKNGIGRAESFHIPEGYFERAQAARDYFERQYQYRWQFLAADFRTRFALSGTESGDRFVVEPDGRNTILVLDLIREGYADLFDDLVADLTWLLGHIHSARLFRDSGTRDLTLRLYEEDRKAAPTVSTGTSRILSMLVAMYALSMTHEVSPRRYANGIPVRDVLTAATPGLVMIEEPDSALNPGVMRNFVEILRRFTSDPDKPRQVILTTHNPTFLNLFEPEEVRVVERADDGYSTVNEVPDHIRDIWLKDGEYRLGDVWLTNSFGGVAW